MYKVEKFIYNGFSVNPPKQGWGKFEEYTATFKIWTNDPGIAICDCSDGIQRNIPSCCLRGGNKLPEQDMSNKILFGESCCS